MDHARAAVSNLVRHSSPAQMSLGGLMITAEGRFNNVHGGIEDDDESKAVLGATVWVVSQTSL